MSETKTDLLDDLAETLYRACREPITKKRVLEILRASQPQTPQVSGDLKELADRIHKLYQMQRSDGSDTYSKLWPILQSFLAHRDAETRRVLELARTVNKELFERVYKSPINSAKGMLPICEGDIKHWEESLTTITTLLSTLSGGGE